MIDYILYTTTTLIAFILMEFIAILSHKYIMHGPGWFLHKSHHKKHNNKFELNDIYFIFFSIPSILCIIYGILNNHNFLFFIGIGIMLYGLVYLILHDLIVHKRFGIKMNFKNSYLKKIKNSHLKHHSNKNKNNATNFGFISYL